MKMSGSVKWFDNAKGYGFLNSNEDGDTKDYFVHYRSILSGRQSGYKTLTEGQSVEFTATQSDKGWQAVEVVVR